MRVGLLFETLTHLVLALTTTAWVAQIWGVTGPFWFAFVGSGVILAFIGRGLAHIAHDDDSEPVAAA